MYVKSIPEGYHTVTPYLTVDGAGQVLDFLKKAFDAVEVFRMSRPDGSIGHAELRIGDSLTMLAEAGAECKPMPTALYIYVNDTDATYRRAIEAGASSLMQPADQFHGDRNAGVKDAAGNYWWIATHVEDVPPDELARRAEAASKAHSGC
jgi:PhnB protein